MKRRLMASVAAMLLTGPALGQDTFGGGAMQQQGVPNTGAQWGAQPPQNGQWGAQPPQGGQWGGQPMPTPNGGQSFGQGPNLDQLMQMEKQDFGVQPTAQLHAGPMHGPTPTSIPGGQLITTKGLLSLVQGNQAPYFLFDVLGGPETLPGAMPAAFLAQPGSFNDPMQQQFAYMLQQGTQGRKDIPLIFYCLSTQCWMSYNAALRAINAGYTNVLWYRGGIEAWKAAGLPTQFMQQGGYPQPPGGVQPQPGGYPQQPGGYPQQPGGYPQQPGGFPQQPGGFQQQ